MTKSAEDYRNDAREALERREESFQRSDTDGFLSQWASGMSAQLANARAKIVDDGNQAEFCGLYKGPRRIKARLIDTKYGTCWLLHEDETELIEQRGSQFVPTGNNSRIQKKLGLSQKMEWAPAWAKLDGQGTGLSGTCWVQVFRTGDKWGQDAVLVPE